MFKIVTGVFYATLLLLSIVDKSIAAEFEDFKPTTEDELDELLSTLESKALPQLSDFSDCYLSLDHLTSIYFKSKSFWLNKNHGQSSNAFVNLENYPLLEQNLIANFKVVASEQTKSIEQVKDFLIEEKQGSFNKEQLTEKISLYDRGLHPVFKIVTEVELKETAFLYLISQSKKLMTWVSDMSNPSYAFIQSEKCANSGVLGILANFHSDFSQTAAQIEKMRAYIFDTRRKRKVLFRKHVYSLRDWYFEEYAKITLEDLSTLKIELAANIKLDDLGTEAIEYWQSENSIGLASNRHRRNLEFYKPLRELALTATRLENYKNKIEALPGVNESAKVIYLEKIESFLSVVNKEIVALVEKGWQGQLKRQVFLNERRLAQSSRYSSTCLKKIKDHIELAEKTKTEKDWIKSRELYQNVLKECQ